MNTVSKYSIALCCAVAALCAAGPASAQTLSLRLNGYIPNDYAVCRDSTGVSGGTACDTSADCPLGQTCRNRFSDVSCTTTTDCTNKIGMGSLCVDTVVLPGNVLKRCSPIANVPQGVVSPGDTIIVEAYIEDWDVQPDIGRCANGTNPCDMNDPDPCESCREFRTPPGEVCETDAECSSPDTCQIDRHCTTDRNKFCETVSDCPPGAGQACVARECLTYPAIASYQWTVDRATFASGHGPNSVLRMAQIDCVAGDELDTCDHGNTQACTCNQSNCEGGFCDTGAQAYIEGLRGNFIFTEFGFSPQKQCSITGADPVCSSVSSTSNPIGVVDDGMVRYLGSLAIDVPGPGRACGTYDVGFKVAPNETFIRDTQATSVPVLAYQDLALTMTPEPVCDPPDCDDNNLCTLDECTCAPFGDPCVHTPFVKCLEGEVCDPSTGQCVPGLSGACCVGEVCTETSQANCGGEYLGDGTTCDPNPCIGGAANVVSWESVAAHGAVGEVGLVMPENGSYTEPRSTGVRKIIVTYDGPVTAAGSIATIPAACDVDDQPVNLAGITIATAQGAANEVIITFTPQLPGSGLTPGTHDPARYEVVLSGVGGAASDTSRQFSVVLGDAFGVPLGTGDARVNAQDNGFVRSFAAAGINPIDPGNTSHVRSDVFTNGAINAQDNGLVRSLAAEALNGQGLTLTCGP